jgi:UDP-N-acetylmuramate: L-alanyl-gamma-D-glutamyl-meso-diaminopimelate ligase
VEAGQRFVLHLRGEPVGEFTLPMSGEHNVANAVAAIGMCIEHVRIDPAPLAGALASFPGVARRQHVVGTPGGVQVVDDFGHHPTAVRTTIDGLRAQSEGRIIAVLRPASATACRSLHQDGWVDALGAADVAVLAPLARTNIPAPERLDLERLAADLSATGTECHRPDTLDAIPGLVAPLARPGDTIVFFSNSDTASTLSALVDALAHHGTI